jgi:hypothetical protein
MARAATAGRGEGIDIITQSAEETVAVRTREQLVNLPAGYSPARVTMKSPIRENRPPGYGRGHRGTGVPAAIFIDFLVDA